MDLRKVLKAAKDQGWRLEPTRDGFRLVPPDSSKQAVAFHDDPPENSIKRGVALMKKQGFVWPPPPKKGR